MDSFCSQRRKEYTLSTLRPAYPCPLPMTSSAFSTVLCLRLSTDHPGKTDRGGSSRVLCEAWVSNHSYLPLQDVYLNPNPLNLRTLSRMARDYVDVFKLKILRWGVYPALSEGAQQDHKSPYNREVGDQSR